MPTYTKTYRQTYRVADDSLERWELYVGEDAMPDFEDSTQPVATSASLPFSWTPPVADSGETLQLYCVVRKRSKYNLLSFNQYPTIIEVDDLGEEVFGPLTDPELLSVQDGDSGSIVVLARYPYGLDVDEADVWEVYVKAGSIPDPEVDSPAAVQAFGRAGVDYLLNKTISGLTPGTTYYVMVAVIRSDDSDGVRGESNVVQHTATTAIDLDEGDVEVFEGGS